MIFIISGDVGAGKTTFFRKVVEGLQSRGVPVAGFVSERVFREGTLVGYDIVDIGTVARTPWLRRGGSGESIGPFTISAAGLAAAAAIIGTSDPSGLLAVDELGPLELEGWGFWTSLKPLLDAPGRSFLFVIRAGCLPGFQGLFTGWDVRIFPLTDRKTPDETAGEMALHVCQG
jgi:nucleoside-triphosphatase THEP1